MVGYSKVRLGTTEGTVGYSRVPQGTVGYSRHGRVRKGMVGTVGLVGYGRYDRVL